jgi:hypothetical protein
MSSSQAPTSPPNERGDPQTVVYDPNDPFWRDTDDDDDDMDYQPAEGGSEEDEDGEGDLSFHGRLEFLIFGQFVFSSHYRCCGTIERSEWGRDRLRIRR